jgi:high-affinity Fe2+/Pb2+ permease
VLAGGLVALAMTVGLAQWLVSEVNRPGPGTVAVVGHATAALAAIGLQLVADRSHGLRRFLAAGSILVLFAGVLWFGWWA